VPREIVFRPTERTGGRFEVNPAFAAGFAALGIDSAAGFLELPGEVVCGHPDRHVMRVALPGFPAAFYLKRQHSVTWRERLRNRLAGFGGVSRCGRETAILKRLAAAGLPVPRWAAAGEDERGRAFLLVEEVAGAHGLRQALSDSPLSPAERGRLAERLGRLIARFHAAGFTTPDLTAKHVLVSPGSGEITLIDWQSARRVKAVPVGERVRALAALHASLPEELASPHERLRVLRAAFGPGRLAEFARCVEREAAKLRERRSIRDQRQPAVTASPQRLVWVAGEAVCAVPDVAASWPRPAVAPPFYGCEPGSVPVRLPDGREGILIRGRSFSPLGRFWAKLRGRPWRSPGVTLGRVLFHLERYDVPAPRLLAFGQRFTGPATAEWFALHTIPGEPVPARPDAAAAEQLGRVLRALHDAGCRPVGQPLAVLGELCVRDVTRIRIVRRITAGERAGDLAALVAPLPERCHPAARAGYDTGLRREPRRPDRIPAVPPRTCVVS
jgi:tRNA A-37 threonylcarbamoyl transferase component Bud32